MSNNSNEIDIYEIWRNEFLVKEEKMLALEQHDLIDIHQTPENILEFAEKLMWYQEAPSNENVEMEDIEESSETYWRKWYKRFSDKNADKNEYLEEIEDLSKLHSQFGWELSYLVEDDIINGRNRMSFWPLWSGILQFDSGFLIWENENWIQIKIPSRSLNLQSFYSGVVSNRKEHETTAHQGSNCNMMIKLAEWHEGICLFELYCTQWKLNISMF